MAGTAVETLGGEAERMIGSAAFGGAGLRRSIVASTAAISTIGMTVLVGLLLFVTDRTSDRELDSALGTRVSAVLATASTSGGRLRILDANDALFDTLTWVYDASGTRLEGPRIPAPLRSTVGELASATSLRHAAVEPWRLRAEPIRGSSGRLGTVVVAASDAQYTSVLGRTAVAGVLLGLVVVAGMTLLAWAIVRRALAPVAVMAAAAEAWSQDRLEERFGLGPPRDELTALGAVLDALLERVSQVIRAEQRLTAELAHELRTPLTVIKGEADLGRMASGLSQRERARFERIAAAASDMGSAMTTLLDVARGSTGGDARTPVSPVIEAILARTVRDGLRVEQPVTEAVTAVPRDLLERILAPVLENAVRYADSRLTIGLAERDSLVEVVIGNDGAPVAADEDQLFSPGFSEPGSPGAGLGLALSRRLARAVGGDVVLVSAAPAAFAVTLPGADPPARREVAA